MQRVICISKLPLSCDVLYGLFTLYMVVLCKNVFLVSGQSNLDISLSKEQNILCLDNLLDVYCIWTYQQMKFLGKEIDATLV